jgi:hypothetical protein
VCQNRQANEAHALELSDQCAASDAELAKLREMHKHELEQTRADLQRYMDRLQTSEQALHELTDQYNIHKKVCCCVLFHFLLRGCLYLNGHLTHTHIHTHTHTRTHIFTHLLTHLLSLNQRTNERLAQLELDLSTERLRTERLDRSSRELTLQLTVALEENQSWKREAQARPISDDFECSSC